MMRPLWGLHFMRFLRVIKLVKVYTVFFMLCQNQYLMAEISVLIRIGDAPMEGRGLSPATGKRLVLGALASEAALLHGLKAPSTVPLIAAGLKPRPSKALIESAYYCKYALAP